MGIRARPFYSGVQSDDQFASGRFPTSLFNCNRSAIADSSAEHCAAARLSQFTLLFSLCATLNNAHSSGDEQFHSLPDNLRDCQGHNLRVNYLPSSILPFNQWLNRTESKSRSYGSSPTRSEQ